MRVLVMVNERSDKAREASILLSAYFMSQGIESVHVNSDLLPERMQRDDYGRRFIDDFTGEPDPRFIEPFDLAVALGGDGTILRTARMVRANRTPILGINFGHLGFLVNECDDRGVIAMVADALAGDCAVEERATLRADIVCAGDDMTYEDDYLQGENGERSFFAMNEITVARGASGHIVTFDLDISGEHVARMRGDGLVVASATGSTAYAMSAGGPLVSPGYRGLVVVPIAPHTLLSRAIVTAENDVVELDLTHDRTRCEIAVFADGDALTFDMPIESLSIRRGDDPVFLLHTEGPKFYTKLANTFFMR